MPSGLSATTFNQVSLDDPLFDSLKAQYAEFSEWFEKKAAAQEPVLIVQDDTTNELRGFVYLKLELGEIEDVQPKLPAAKRLKVGTLKIIAHGTKLGERVIKKIFDKALSEDVDQIYVTVFDTHQNLINLFKRYGFSEIGMKNTPNGDELVLLRDMRNVVGNDPIVNYPFLQTAGKRFFLLAIYPKYHTKLFPDSLLKTEKSDIVQDVSYTNTIHKIYVGGVALTRMKPGDLVVIYRTSDKKGPAKYRSVATSICVVEEAKSRRDFANEDEFVNFCIPHSVFSEGELRARFVDGKRLFVAKMLYNLALPKRPIRKILLEVVGIPEQPIWDFKEISRDQFLQIMELGEANESIIVN